MKKIRVLLGGYVNNINAQDLNCRSLAMFLDKNVFDISAFLVPQEFKDFEIGDELAGVNLIQLNRPAKLLWYWIYLKGIFNCDIAYLPKGQKRHWCKFLCMLFRKKSFTTVEGLMEQETLEGAVRKYGSVKKVRNVYNAWDKTFAITKYMSDRNYERCGIKSDGVLYLGVDSEFFKVENKQYKQSGSPLDFIFIGTDIRRKRLDEFIKIAKQFPDDRFHIVGGGENEDIYKTLGVDPVENVQHHGKLSHTELKELLATMDLHVFPSRSEGFPKVILETAAAGVPSIVYGDYGATEWIENGISGFVVESFEEIIDIINDIKENHDKLYKISRSATSMASRFEWREVIKKWERVLIDLNRSR